MANSWWEAIKRHRMLNVIIAVLLLSLVFIFRGSRTLKNSNNETVPVKVSKKSRNLELSIYLPQSRFPFKTEIPFTLSVVNMGEGKASLFFSTSQKFDLVIKSATGKEVWRWSKGRLFTMAIEELFLKKGEKLTQRVAWPQLDFSGMQVSPGKYLAIGESKAPEITEKVEVEFVIEPPTERTTESR